MPTYTVSTPQGYTQTFVDGGSYDLFDASGGGTWEQANAGSPQQKYPVRVRSQSVRIQVKGGVINGHTSLTGFWNNIYYPSGNSAGVLVQNCPDGSSVTDWEMTEIFDGIRMNGVENFKVERIHIDTTRDDAIEIDTGEGGQIRDCLLENCFAGVSLGDNNTPVAVRDKTCLMERVLISVKVWPIYSDGSGVGGSGRMASGYASPIKGQFNMPKMVVHDNVWAIPDGPSLIYPDRLWRTFDRVQAESSGNYLLNLSDTPLVAGFPGGQNNIPASFTVLQGQPARDHWTAARAAYFGGPPPIPDPDPGVFTNVVSVNPTSGAIAMETNFGAYATTVTVGASNAHGSDTDTVSITVS